jgi:hypothetical protein
MTYVVECAYVLYLKFDLYCLLRYTKRYIYIQLNEKFITIIPYYVNKTVKIPEIHVHTLRYQS